MNRWRGKYWSCAIVGALWMAACTSDGGSAAEDDESVADGSGGNAGSVALASGGSGPGLIGSGGARTSIGGTGSIAEMSCDQPPVDASEMGAAGAGGDAGEVVGGAAGAAGATSGAPRGYLFDSMDELDAWELETDCDANDAADTTAQCADADVWWSCAELGLAVDWPDDTFDHVYRVELTHSAQGEGLDLSGRTLTFWMRVDPVGDEADLTVFAESLDRDSMPTLLEEPYAVRGEEPLDEEWRALTLELPTGERDGFDPSRVQRIGLRVSNTLDEGMYTEGVSVRRSIGLAIDSVVW